MSRVEEQVLGLNRRFAQLAVPGLTEPKPVSGLIVPAPSVPAASNQGQTRSSGQTIVELQRKRARARQIEKQLNPSEIESVEFSLFSTEQIDRYAVVTVTSPEEYGSATVRDLRMGPHNDSEPCETCGSDLRGCPGHNGRIVLPKMMHPLSINTIILVLTLVCNDCGGLLLTREELERAGIARLSGERRLQAMKDLIKAKTTCKRYADDPNVRPCRANPIFASLKDNKESYKLAFTYPGRERSGEIHHLYPDIPPGVSPDNVEEYNSIYKILNAISDEDAELMGFIEGAHPRNMIIERLMVIPYCARPDLRQGDKFQPDDLTNIYIDIVKKNRLYQTSMSEVDREENLQRLYYTVSNLMRNDGRYNQGRSKPITDVKKRLQGKGAIVRANIMGKTVNFAGRTVVGPAAYLRVDEIGLPREMTRRLTRPIKVTEMNREELQAAYDEGRVMHITMQSGRYAGSRVMVSESIRKTIGEYRLNLGDIVERSLQDGDLVLVNRQPTLHKQNILAVYVRLIDDRVVRINLSITTPLNADYDGDELNVHVPQTIEAYAEAEQLMAVYRNLMNAQKNIPMMGIVYDTLTGVDLLTRPQYEVDQLTAQISKLNTELSATPVQSERFRQLQTTLNAAQERLRVVEQRVLLDPIVYNQAIIQVADTPQMVTLYDRLNKYGVDPASGRGLVSAAFPEDFDYNANGVLISEGVLRKGVLTKKTITAYEGSIIAEMFKQLGGLVTVDFMSEIQFIVREYLAQRGMTVSPGDCMPSDPEFRRQIDETISTARMQVIATTGLTANRIRAEEQERKIGTILESAKNRTVTQVQANLHPDNNLLIMANSGAKGSTMNAAMMSAALGQIKVSGKRIQRVLPGNRTLPIFEPNDPDPRSQGFCVNSYASGLEPSEFWWQAMAGRENVTDTAVNTATTGFLQHQLIKSAEDIHIAPDGSVRTADNAIIEFVYGGDSFSADELSNVKINGEAVPLYRNLEQVANKINQKYGVQ